MGQSGSVATIPRRDREGGSISNDLEFLQEQIRKHSLTLRQLAGLSYNGFQEKIKDLNALSSTLVDFNGKQLLFEIKHGSDANVLWKGTVRVKCIKLNPRTRKIEKCRELNLKQFLQVYNTMQQHLNMGIVEFKPQNNTDFDKTSEETAEATASCSKEFALPSYADLNASIFMEKLSEILPDDEAGGYNEDCCICMERKPEVSLPCAHSYCLACIEQWNVNNKTCPICREALETTDDTWVLEDRPDPDEVTKEIRKSLFNLTK